MYIHSLHFTQSADSTSYVYCTHTYIMGRTHKARPHKTGINWPLLPLAHFCRLGPSSLPHLVDVHYQSKNRICTVNYFCLDFKLWHDYYQQFSVGSNLSTSSHHWKNAVRWYKMPTVKFVGTPPYCTYCGYRVWRNLLPLVRFLRQAFLLHADVLSWQPHK